MESGYYYDEYEEEEDFGLLGYVILMTLLVILFVPARIFLRALDLVEWLKHTTARY
jgi:hypothetical protein